MTEGIIQEVLAKLINYYETNQTQLYYGFNIRDSIERTQQELIEKIKLEICSCYEQEPYWSAIDLLKIQKKLIGDNQQ